MAAQSDIAVPAEQLPVTPASQSEPRENGVQARLRQPETILDRFIRNLLAALSAWHT